MIPHSHEVFWNGAAASSRFIKLPGAGWNFLKLPGAGRERSRSSRCSSRSSSCCRFCCACAHCTHRAIAAFWRRGAKLGWGPSLARAMVWDTACDHLIRGKKLPANFLSKDEFMRVYTFHSYTYTYDIYVYVYI